MANINCEGITAARQANKKQIRYYRSRVSAKIDQLIGAPALSPAINSLKPRDASLERQRYRAQKKLHDYLVSTLMELGQIKGHIVEDIDIFGDLLHIQSHENNAALYNFSETHYATILERLGKTKQWLSKVPAEKPLTLWEQTFGEMLRIILSRDKFGIAAKFMLKVRSFSDNSRSLDIEYIRTLSTKEKSIHDLIREKVSNNIKNTDDIGHLIFGGLEGFFTRDKREVVIVGTSIADNSYSVFYLDSNGNRIGKTPKVVNKSEISVIGKKDLPGENRIRSAIQLAAHKFYRRLLNGRVRHVEFVRTPHNIEEEGDFNDVWRKSRDGMFVGRALSEAGKEKDTREKLGLQPDVHPQLHTVKFGAWELTYVMVKQGEGVPGQDEVYKAYYTKARRGDKVIMLYNQGDVKLTESTANLGLGISKEILYRKVFLEANDHKIFQKPRVIGATVEGEPILSEGGKFRAYYNFFINKDYDNIPEDIVDEIHAQITETRVLNKDFWENLIKKRIGYMERSIKKAVERPDVTRAEVLELARKISGVGGARHTIDVRGGEVTMLMGGLQKLKPKRINFDPVRFKDGVYEDTADRVMASYEKKLIKNNESLEKWERDLANKKVAADLYNKHTAGIHKENERLENDIEVLERTRDIMLDKVVDGEETPDQMSYLFNPVHLRTTSAMMDHMQREEDFESQIKYYESTAMALVMDELRADLLDALIDMRTNPSVQNLMIDSVKKAFGDPTYSAKFFGADMGFEKLAKIFNKLNFAGKMRGEEDPYRIWTADKVQFWGIMQNMGWTAKHLGKFTATQNNLQILNPIILHGLGTYRTAKGLLDNDVWKKRVEDTGVLVLLNALNEILLGRREGDPTLRDYPLIKYSKAAATMAMTKKAFMNTPDKAIDTVIMRSAALGDSAEEARRLKQLKKIYWELVNGEDLEGKNKSQQIQITMARLQKLKKKWSKRHMREAAMFTLSWFPFTGGKGFFTFTGVEERLRATTAIMEMLVARDTMLVPIDDEAEFYRHPLVIQKARFGVYLTQFGMSQQYLAGFFGGFGKSFGQFKTYPYFETLQEFRLMENFFNSFDGQSAMENVETLTRRIGDAAYASFKKESRSSSQKKQDIHLMRMFRLMMIRGVASFLSTLLTFNPYAWDLVKSIKGIAYGGSWSLFSSAYFRGAESPALSILIRLMMLPLIIGAGDDDKEERILRDYWRLLLPPLVTFTWEIINKIKKGESPAREIVGNPF